MGRAYEVRKASIQKTGAAKAKVYSLYAKEIYRAAKKSTDPEANSTLKRLIEKAKREQVPSDIIKRAIDKVNSGVDENYESVRYEGFGPGASTLVIDCLTDNINRTISYIRTVFAKTKAKMGVLNSVSYQYDNCCVLSFKGMDEEKVLDVLLEAEIDVQEIEKEEDLINVYGEPSDLFKIKTALLAINPDLVFETDEIMLFPKDTIKLSAEDQEQFNKLLQLLEDIEDVQNVYHNVELE